MTEEEAKRLDKDAGLGCAIWGYEYIIDILDNMKSKELRYMMVIITELVK